ncbi:MAG: hypothetical protein ACJAT4_003002 [Granulosicoccus sp.]|jgi:hypothetical protein
MGFILEDGKRAEFFFGSIFYVVALLFVTSFLSILNESLAVLLLMIFYALIPLGIVSWYLKLTSKSLSEVKNLENSIKFPKEMDDILDSEEIFKPIEE